ncbi:MAG: DUF309 domain-containing protein [Myxococcales bacterium]|nr:DUF309 domain-containing protein [Myxococcales bacterium]
MKTHPKLLVRDALAGLFVAAAAGDPEANRALEELDRFAHGAAPGPALRRLRSEDGSGLFAPGGLESRFAPLGAYVKDRAQRFAAARIRIRETEAEREPMEQARAAWHAGLFFEVHEILEPVWLAATGLQRQRLQGMIMAGAALHHLADGNLAGARSLLREAAAKLEGSGSGESHRFGSFGQALARLAGEIEKGSLRSIEELGELPVLERRD